MIKWLKGFDKSIHIVPRTGRFLVVTTKHIIVYEEGNGYHII